MKHKPTILLAEDSPSIRRILQIILGEKYTIIEAADGEQALEQARRLLPDLLISDVVMPRMDGITLVRHLRSDPRTSQIPIILLSGEEDTAALRLETGVEECVKSLQGRVSCWDVWPEYWKAGCKFEPVW